MEKILADFLRLVLTDTKEASLAFWEANVRPTLKNNDDLSVAHTTYTPLLDQRWWMWCERYDRTKGTHALQRLLLTSQLKWEASQTLQQSALPDIMRIPVVRTTTFAPSAGSGYVASSPYILPNPDEPTEFLVFVRHVNYTFTEKNEYPLLPEYVKSAPRATRDCVRTKTVAHVCTQALDIRTTGLLTDHSSFIRWPSPVLDLEDLRIVALPSGSLVGVASSREVVVSTLPQPVLVYVSWANKEIIGGVRLIPHAKELECIPQKNWLPFWCTKSQRLLAFYAYGPEAVLYAIDPCTGACTVDQSWKTGLAMHACRGGAPPVPWEDGMFISAVHTSLQTPNVRRKYFHRFVLHASDYRPVAISQQWNFSGEAYDAEFVISCARASPSSFYIGYGQNDGASIVAEVSTDTIKDLWWYKL